LPSQSAIREGGLFMVGPGFRACACHGNACYNVPHAAAHAVEALCAPVLVPVLRGVQR